MFFFKNNKIITIWVYFIHEIQINKIGDCKLEDHGMQTAPQKLSNTPRLVRLQTHRQVAHDGSNIPLHLQNLYLLISRRSSTCWPVFTAWDAIGYKNANEQHFCSGEGTRLVKGYELSLRIKKKDDLTSILQIKHKWKRVHPGLKLNIDLCSWVSNSKKNKLLLQIKGKGGAKYSVR